MKYLNTTEILLEQTGMVDNSILSSIIEEAEATNQPIPSFIAKKIISKKKIFLENLLKLWNYHLRD